MSIYESTEWKQYELDLLNHKARIKNKRDFLDAVLRFVEIFGIESTRRDFNTELDRELFMDAPNEPGYYRANND